MSIDRARLDGFVDYYLDALIAHDPGLLPATEDVRFTENGQQLELGDGLWNTMAGRGSYRLFATDVPAGQVAFIGTIREQGPTPDSPVPALLAVRLPVGGDRVAEIEMIVVRDADAATRVEGLGQPHAKFTTPVPRGPSGVQAEPGRHRERLFRRHAAQRREGPLPVRR